MNCARARKMCSALVDGRLSPRRAWALESHLETCDDCGSMLRDLQGMKMALVSAPTPSPGSDFWSRTLAAARAGRPAARERGMTVRLQAWQRIAGWATACAVASLLIVTPVRIFQSGEAGAGRVRQVVAWHAGHSSRQPLADASQMNMLTMHAHFPDAD